MLPAQGGYTRIVNLRPGDPTTDKYLSQRRLMRAAFGEKDQRRRFHPCFDLVERPLERRRRREDPRMGYDREKLMQTRPGNGPACNPFSEFRQPSGRGIVKRRFIAVRIHENVGVDCNHVPRPR